MNIFYLDPSPSIAASMHCDQHLHKMILESAQMVSTALHSNPNVPYKLKSHLYRAAYQKHPCTKLLCSDMNACAWVISLCDSLENIRLNLGYNPHNSMDVINISKEYIDTKYTEHDAIFCGPAIFNLNNAQYPTIPLKYQAFYHHKAKQWALDGKPRMSYKNRPIPEFLRNSEWINHD